MKVSRLQLEDFRNYTGLSMIPGEGLNVIYGSNGQGKTNIVEAIYVCAAGRSHRTARDADMVKSGCKNFRITIEFEKRNQISGTMQPQSVSVQYDGKKKVFVNEVPARRLVDMIGHFQAVMFSPEEMAMIKEGPSCRRRFVDIAQCQSSANYLFFLQRYQRALEQKNRLLKKIFPCTGTTGEKEKKQVEVWNGILAEAGHEIMKIRDKYTLRLNRQASEIFHTLSSQKEALEIRYSPSLPPSLEHREQILETMNKNLQREIQQGAALIGPHRDDWNIRLNGEDIRVYGSQGQQRTATLSLIMAEALLMEEDTRQKPVIILDDIMSELDADRQKQLSFRLRDWQVFVTCTDEEIFRRIEGIEAAYYRVVDGKID